MAIRPSCAHKEAACLGCQQGAVEHMSRRAAHYEREAVLSGRWGAHRFEGDSRPHGGLGEDHGHGEAREGLVAVVATLQRLLHLQRTNAAHC